MIPPLRSLVAATALVAAFASTSVLAGPLVEAPAYTPNHGLAGGPTVFRPELTITNDGSVGFNNVYLWDFILDWDETVLAFDPAASTIAFGAGGMHAYSGSLSGVAAHIGTIGVPATANDNSASAAADGYYVLNWESDGTNFLDLGTAINFVGAFRILAGATPGDYLFDFEANGVSSTIIDMNLIDFTYSDVTQGSKMMIKVDAPTGIPEPAMVGLLLGGLGAYLGALRLRRRAG